MSARVLNIVEKTAPNEFFPAVPRNFRVSEGESVPAEIVIDDPNVSLYCLDDEQKQAWFVETPPGVDLTQAPFFYVTQYQTAQRLIAVPYNTLHQLADTLPRADDRLLLIYSVGRCGSTLISQSLGAVPNVVSYSEPDVYTQLTMMRYADPSRDDEYVRLLRSCTALLGKRAPWLALKFRANVTHIGGLLHRAFPGAKNLFLYRHAETWAQSMNSAFAGGAPPLLADPIFFLFLASSAPMLPPFMQRQGREPVMVESFTLLWLSVMDTYLKLCEQGIPFLALRYEDIKAQPKRVLSDTFAYCGLPLDEVDAAYAAFSKDSQEGTGLSQANLEQRRVQPLGADHYAQLRAVLEAHPVIQTPGFIAPNTLTFAQA